jgi:hypothetical protein
MVLANQFLPDGGIDWHQFDTTTFLAGIEPRGATPQRIDQAGNDKTNPQDNLNQETALRLPCRFAHVTTGFANQCLGHERNILEKSLTWQRIYESDYTAA